GLDEQSRHPRIEAGGEPVDQDRLDVLLKRLGALVASGQRMPVGHEEIALVLVLKVHPVAQRPVVVAEMQCTSRTHAGQHTPGLWIGAHATPRRLAGRAKWMGGY